MQANIETLGRESSQFSQFEVDSSLSGHTFLDKLPKFASTLMWLVYGGFKRAARMPLGDEAINTRLLLLPEQMRADLLASARAAMLECDEFAQVVEEFLARMGDDLSLPPDAQN